MQSEFSITLLCRSNAEINVYSFLNFQSTLACLCLEVNILISSETKVKIASFFWKLDQSSNAESWQ